jgi:hypothetical protein
MKRWPWLLFLCLAALIWGLGRGGSTGALAKTKSGSVPCPLPPAYVDAAHPLQSPLPSEVQPFEFDGARISPLAGFSLQARVLSREDYSVGPESRFSPTDLALGWGPMSQAGLAERLHVSQGSRWYRYGWAGGAPPLPLRDIIVNSANMHMVPADATAARRLQQVRAGDVVKVQGWLIRIDDASGWTWSSSLSREDQGDGSCELVLVCAIE